MIPSAIGLNLSTPHEAAVNCRVLFLCTGNYYRSRFAEELFNALAIQRALPWRAASVGFTPHPDINPGSISRFTLHALAERNIIPLAAARQPVAVKASDFSAYPRCIALSEQEHRPMMERLFPESISKVRFWQVEDLAWEKPENAIPKIEAAVRHLLEEINARA